MVASVLDSQNASWLEIEGAMKLESWCKSITNSCWKARIFRTHFPLRFSTSFWKSLLSWLWLSNIIGKQSSLSMQRTSFETETTKRRKVVLINMTMFAFSKEMQWPAEKTERCWICKLSGSGESHRPGWRAWSNAQDSKTMRVVRVHSVQTPPGHDPFPFSTCVCWVDCCLLRLYAFSSCVKNMETQSFYRRGESLEAPIGCAFSAATWKSASCADLSSCPHTLWWIIRSSTSRALCAETDSTYRNHVNSKLATFNK